MTLVTSEQCVQHRYLFFLFYHFKLHQNASIIQLITLKQKTIEKDADLKWEANIQSERKFICINEVGWKLIMKNIKQMMYNKPKI